MDLYTSLHSLFEWLNSRWILVYWDGSFMLHRLLLSVRLTVSCCCLQIIIRLTGISLSCRSIRRHSKAFYNRTGLMSMNSAPSHLKVLDFLSHYKKPQPPVNLRLAKTPQTTDTWRQKPIHLSPPSRVDVCFITNNHWWFMYHNIQCFDR